MDAITRLHDAEMLIKGTLMSESEIELNVDLTGLVQIFGDALYTEFGSVVRELVQNAHDSIVVGSSHGGVGRSPSSPPSQGRIDVIFIESERILAVADNGIGMSAHDLASNLNNFGNSQKRALQKALHKEASEVLTELIGEYGVGFLAAMAVSSKVEVWSKREGQQTASWELNAGSKHARVREVQDDSFAHVHEKFRIPSSQTGTLIVCCLSERIIDEYCVDTLNISGSLTQYTRILPVPIHFNGRLINPLPKAWQYPAHASVRDWQDSIVEMTGEEALYTIPLYSPRTELDLQGVLWFPKRLRIQDEGKLDIFIKRMFVISDDGIVLPQWARFIRGILNSNQLRRIVSGNTVKRDNYAALVTNFLTQRIHDAFIDLRALADDEYWKIVGQHDDVIKECAVDNPDLLKLVWDKLRLRVRNRALTIPAYLDELHKLGGTERRIYFFEDPTQEFAANLVSDSTRIPIFELSGRADNLFAEAACAANNIEKVNFRSLADKHFTLLEPDEASHYRTLLSACAESNIAADLRRYEPTHVPAILIEDKTMLERRQELLTGLREATGERQRQFIEDLEKLFNRDRAANRGVAFYLNVGNNLIRDLREAPYDAQVAICLALYNMSYMSAVPELRRNEIQTVYGSICSVLMDMLRQTKTASDHSMSSLPTGIDAESRIGQHRSLDRPVQFMLFMPYQSRYQNIEAAVRRVFEDKPYYFDVVLARDFMRDGRIIESVRTHISESDAFIAEISDANPSVMMEVGAALIARASPIFLLRSELDAIAEIPADLRAQLHIPYGRIDDSVDEIVASIRSSIERNGSPSHLDTQKLLAGKRKRALTRTLFAQIRYRLRDDEVAQMLRRFANLEVLLSASASQIASAVGMKEADAEAFRTSLMSYVEA
jgi:molecular chaperone HtpG